MKTMFQGSSDHIVLACNSLAEIRDFYENMLGLVPGTVLAGYITYPVGTFSINFKETPGLQDVSAAVVHIGVEFKTRGEVDRYFSKINESTYTSKPSKILGGPGQGPYRFYVKDPCGYTLEIETWEGSSD